MNLDEIYQQLEDAINAAAELLNSASGTTTELNNKEQQLIHIEKTIHQFQNKALPIPDELRNLKLKLVMEIDQIKLEVIFKDKVNRLIQSIFPSIQDSPKIKKISARKNKRKTQGRVSLKEMIDAKRLSPDQEIYALLKGNLTKATITFDGQIKVHSNGQYYDNPSSAGVAVLHRSCNGWTFWKIKEGNKVRDLDYYRKQHKRFVNREV